MLAGLSIEAPLPVLEKYVGGKNVTARGAFFACDTLTLVVKVSRLWGHAGVVLRLAPDGGEASDHPFSFVGTGRGVDTYRLSLSLEALTRPRTHGLFYYELLFLRGNDTLFTDAASDNVGFSLKSHSAHRFRLLVSEDGFVTPSWFHGGTMYHIFVDRFAPRACTRREGAVYHEKWDEEILQFGEYRGAPVANNEFFGGTLWGIIDKLDHLVGLGVSVIYLSPIFKAASNHKYDTGDYECVDEGFGGDAALRALIAAARERGIGIILDGVFNHTGDDSRYFDRYGTYGGDGAYSDPDSPYRDWFYFEEYPNKYLSWWDIRVLPKLRLSNPAVHGYFVGEGGIVERYTKAGVMGWRLDVVDELPNEFLDELRLRVKNATGGEGLIIGEVWENAADKIAYGKRRRYFEGRQLDSVMNYPLREGIVSFVRDGNAAALTRVLRELWGSYPETVCHSLMNVLSTHDTERILTVLGGKPDDGSYSGSELCAMRLTREQRALAIDRLKIAATLQFTVFGVPSLFYGDEAGMEGYRDPFCRRPFPWGREEKNLLLFYRKLGKIRKENAVLADGDFEIVLEAPHALAFSRRSERGHMVVAANCGEASFSVLLPRGATDLLTGKKQKGRVPLEKGQVSVWRVDHVSSHHRALHQKQKSQQPPL